MQAGLRLRSGKVGDAFEIWRELLDDPASDPLTKKIARRKVRELTVDYEIEKLETAVARFRDDNGRYPGTLAELVRASYIRVLPQDPDGRIYAYDPQTGSVSSTAGRLLGKRR
jgi:hypothetical protein